MLDDAIELHDVARILTMIADPPNVRTSPLDDDLEGDFDSWFDGGAMRIETGRTFYQFRDGSSAEVPTSLMWVVSIALPGGARVTVSRDLTLR